MIGSLSVAVRACKIRKDSVQGVRILSLSQGIISGIAFGLYRGSLLGLAFGVYRGNLLGIAFGVYRGNLLAE